MTYQRTYTFTFNIRITKRGIDHLTIPRFIFTLILSMNNTMHPGFEGPNGR